MNNRVPITVSVQPWYKDHSFDGKIVLAGVETMILLAAEALKKQPDLDVSVMEECRFAKFLEIQPVADSVEALVEYEDDINGRLQAKLLSKVQVGRMRRIKEHGELRFSATAPPPPSMPGFDRPLKSIAVKEVSAKLIYRDLVPFGPCYHTLQQNLVLTENGAWGQLQAPELPFTDPIQDVVGSPFPLDGAMHAACVLGQQFVDYAPFPTGFKRRVIIRPTLPGGKYLTRVFPVSLTEDELVFDLCIYNEQGDMFETVENLRMRNVGLAPRT